MFETLDASVALNVSTLVKAAIFALLSNPVTFLLFWLSGWTLEFHSIWFRAVKVLPNGSTITTGGSYGGAMIVMAGVFVVIRFFIPRKTLTYQILLGTTVLLAFAAAVVFPS